ncbi:MAG: efflux RND transporter permease subunit, partial [Deltaproteobacteria bacterium]
MGRLGGGGAGRRDMTGGGFGAFSVDRPVATVMVVSAVIVFGWISLAQLPVSLMPELAYPTLTVRVDYPGAAPEEVEEGLARPIEELVRTVEGVQGVTSVSRAGSAEVVLRFQWGVGLDVAGQKVRERLDLIVFPEGSERPEILRYDPDLDPILTFALSGEVGVERLRHVADEEIRRAVEGVAGVAMVRVRGGEEEVVRVDVSEAGLQRTGLTIEAIEERLRAENVNVAGGRLVDGERELLVRTLNELGSVEELAALVVAVRGEVLIRLEDVATVRRAFRDRRSVHRMDGREAVEIAVFKEADANVVAVAEAVKAMLFGRAQLDALEERDPPGGMAASLPEGFALSILSDQSAYVRAAIGEVARTALLGGLCAVLVLLVFLGNLRATLIVALAIPLSVVAAFVPLRMMGLSLNLMTLGGLALGVGMLVDNAIVVLEAIVRRQEEGEERRLAAVHGVGEVAGAVTASTLTTLAVFVPIAFLDGVAGQLFGDLAVAVVLALLASLAFALFFVPTMAALPPLGMGAGPRGPLLRWPSVTALVADLRAWRVVVRRGGARGGLGVLILPVLIGWWTRRTLRWLVLDVLELLWRVVRGSVEREA